MNATEYNYLLSENKELNRKVADLNQEIGSLKAQLSECGVPVRVGDMTILTVTKGGKAV